MSDPSDDPVLLVSRDEGVTTVTLNRPKARNALNGALRRAITETFRELDEDPETQVVVMTGSGVAFCAGLDLKEMGEIGPAASGAVAEGDDRVVETIEACSRPVIGAINGVAITGGFELALACDVLIGSPDARFGDTHARVGILPGWGLSQKLARMVGTSRAKLSAFTGNFIPADRALDWGLLAEVVPADELIPHCTSLARDMMECDPRTLRGYKRLIDDGLGMPYAEARRVERRVSAEHMKGVTGEQVAERRKGITERGRSQKS